MTPDSPFPRNSTHLLQPGLGRGICLGEREGAGAGGEQNEGVAADEWVRVTRRWEIVSPGDPDSEGYRWIADLDERGFATSEGHWVPDGDGTHSADWISDEAVRSLTAELKGESIRDFEIGPVVAVRR